MRKPENTLIKSASDKASPGVDVERDGPHIYATIGMRAAYQYPSLPQVACPSIEQGNIHQTRYVLFELGNAVQEPAAPSAVPVPDDLSKVEQAPQNLVAGPNSPDIAGNALVVAPTNRVDVAADPQWGCWLTRCTTL